MLDDLIKLKKINVDDAKVYQLFQISELGREWLEREKHALFMEQPPPQDISGDKALMIDGRRSLLRDIICTIESIQHHIKELENGNGRSE